jgi:hypothetical protein
MLGVLGAVAVNATAVAAELTSVTSAGDATIIALNVDIAEGNADAVEALIRAANEGGRLVSAVRLDSLGGSLAEAI